MPRSINKASLALLFTLFTSSLLLSQTLIPKIDESPHSFNPILNAVNISEDGNFFLTSDANGDAAYRDMETGKILVTASTHNQFYGTTFVGFDNQKVLEVYRSTDDDGSSYISFSIWDILTDDNNEIDIYIPSLEEEDIYSLSKSMDKNLISIRINNEVYVYDVNSKEILTVKVVGIDSQPRQIVESYFEGNEKNITIVTNDESHFTKRKIDVRSNTELRAYNTEPYKVYKLLEGNRSILDKGDALEFVDRQRNLSFSWPKEDVITEEGFFEYDVNCFSFSPNGNQLLLGTGLPFSYSMVGGGLPNIHSGGIISLIDTKSSKIIWQTNNEKRQHQYSVVHLSWLNEKQIFSSDNRGDIHVYDTSSDRYEYAFLRPDVRSIAADIDPNSNSLVYSIFDNSTYNFNFSSNNPVELLDSTYNVIVAKGENGKIGLTGPFKYNHQIIQDGKQLYPPSRFNNQGADIDVSEDYSVVTNSHFENDNFMSEQLPAVSKFIIDSWKDTIGYYIDDLPVFDRSLSHIKYETITDLSPKPDYYPHPNYYNQINIFDHSTNTNLVIFEQKSVDQSWISRYNNILAYSSYNYYEEVSFYQLFDLDKKEWLKLSNKKIVFNCFSEIEPLAFTLYEDQTFQLWNTQNQKILNRGTFNGPIPKLGVIRSFANQVITTAGSNLNTLNYEDGSQSNDDIEKVSIEDFQLSWDQKTLGFESTFSQNGSSQKSINLVNLENDELLYQLKFQVAGNVAQWTGKHNNVYFIDSTTLAWTYDGQGTFNLIDYGINGDDIATLRVFPDGEWIVIAPNGLFDGSKEGRKNVYYLIGQEVVLFDQIKEKYWTPGLLKKILYEPHLLTEYGKELSEGLFPTAELSLPDTKGTLNVKLNQRAGGIGKTSLFINDKEVESDINPNSLTQFTLDLLTYKDYFFQSGVNKIGIQTHNKTGGLSSRQYELYLETDMAKARGEVRSKGIMSSTTPRRRRGNTKKPGLYGLFVGTSKYSNPKLDLGFADKDAIELQKAFGLISKNMYNPSKVDLTLLTSEAGNAASLSSKENILQSLRNIGTKATPNDIIVLFFSGHGMTVGDDFYYLTGKAGNSDLENDSLARVKSTVSSKEINEALRNIKSNKQVMVLDACHSGQITKILQGTSKATSTSQQKALEFLEDKMGVFILASSESNQKSFETDALGQGLLTYSLLRGMSGEAAEQNIINVVNLLNYASEQAEKTSKNLLGRSQRPVLNVGKGGSTFPIGFKNGDLKVSLPVGKVKLSKANFAFLPRANDPEGLEDIFTDVIKERGGIGSKEPFIYSYDNSSDNTFNLSGTYTVSGNDINLTWYINKGLSENLSDTALTIAGSKKDKVKLANDLVDALILKWKEMGLVEE